jgi:hypothetical protein
MADSRCQPDVEVWIREVWLPERFGQAFAKKRLRLQSGGLFEFDAVSADDRVAVSISACGGVTTGGNKATSKMHKIRSDILFLLLADVAQRIVVFSCPKMHALCEAELRGGRLPGTAEILLAQLPAEMEAALASARLVAAREVSPGGVGI